MRRVPGSSGAAVVDLEPAAVDVVGTAVAVVAAVSVAAAVVDAVVVATHGGKKFENWKCEKATSPDVAFLLRVR
jgi:hypothetical protein